MAPKIGREQVVGVGLQTGRDSLATPDYWVQKTGFEFNRADSHVYDTSALGVRAGSSEVFVPQVASAPALSAYFENSAAGVFEIATSDSYSVAATADPSGNVYRHTFKGGISNPTLRFSTISVDDPLEGDQSVIDNLLTDYLLRADTNSIMNFDANYVGGKLATATYTPAFTTPQNFIGKHVTIKFASTVSGLSGASAVKIKNFEFGRTNNVNADDSSFLLGGDARDDHYFQESTATISLGKLLEDQTYIDYMDTGSTVAMELRVVDTGVTIGTSSNPTFIVTFPKVSFMTTIGGDNGTLRTEDIAITLHYGEDDAEAASYQWKTELDNLVTSYV